MLPRGTEEYRIKNTEPQNEEGGVIRLNAMKIISLTIRFPSTVNRLTVQPLCGSDVCCQEASEFRIKNHE